MRAPLAALATLLAALCSVAEDPAPDPGARVRKRAAADAARLLPQRGLGGGETNPIVMGPAEFSEMKIEEPGCEKMTGYMSLPKTFDEPRKCALLFVFHGNGDRGKARVQVLSQITTDIDPVIVIGVQYQELLADGSGKLGLPTLANPDVIVKGCRWLLDKTMKEQAVDPQRVFVGGFSWGTAWSTGWAEEWWKEEPATFPFRAIFLYSSGGAGSKTTIPPIPTVCTVGELETEAAGNFEVLPAVRHYANVIANWGLPVLYHEIPKMGHDVNFRCLQITRDLINDLGGPGSAAYTPVNGSAVPRPEPLELARSDDKYVKELLALLADDRWPDAVARIAAIELDRKIPISDKRASLAFRTELQKLAQTELPRLDKLLLEAAKAEAVPSPFQVRRQKALVEAYAKWPWAQKRQYAETLAKFSDEYPPVARERVRENAMRDAWALEQSGKHDEAKPMYEALAARAGEDGGKSEWPRAAKYRLTWWVDGKK